MGLAEAVAVGLGVAVAVGVGGCRSCCWANSRSRLGRSCSRRWRRCQCVGRFGVGVDANVAVGVKVKVAVGDWRKVQVWRGTLPTEGLAELSTSVRAVSAPHRRVKLLQEGAHTSRATLGQLDHFVALALQQNGQQSALRKSQV